MIHLAPFIVALITAALVWYSWNTDLQKISSWLIGINFTLSALSVNFVFFWLSANTLQGDLATTDRKTMAQHLHYFSPTLCAYFCVHNVSCLLQQHSPMVDSPCARNGN